jgi:hypothetical protein
MDIHLAAERLNEIFFHERYYLKMALFKAIFESGLRRKIDSLRGKKAIPAIYYYGNEVLIKERP